MLIVFRASIKQSFQTEHLVIHLLLHSTLFSCFALQDTDMTHRQGPYGDSIVGIGDGGKEVEGGADQLMSLVGESETVYGSPAFEQWDPYWEDLTRYEM